MRALIFLAAVALLGACGDDRIDPDRCPIDYREPVVLTAGGCGCLSFTTTLTPNDPACPAAVTLDGMCGAEWAFMCGDAGIPNTRTTFDRSGRGMYVSRAADGTVICECPIAVEAP